MTTSLLYPKVKFKAERGLDIFLNTLVLGSIGSGKTSCITRPFFQQSLLEGSDCGGLILDAHGSMQSELVYAFLNAGRSLDDIIFYPASKDLKLTCFEAKDIGEVVAFVKDGLIPPRGAIVGIRRHEGGKLDSPTSKDIEALEDHLILPNEPVNEIPVETGFFYNPLDEDIPADELAAILFHFVKPDDVYFKDLAKIVFIREFNKETGLAGSQRISAILARMAKGHFDHTDLEAIPYGSVVCLSFKLMQTLNALGYLNPGNLKFKDMAINQGKIFMPVFHPDSSPNSSDKDLMFLLHKAAIRNCLKKRLIAPDCNKKRVVLFGVHRPAVTFFEKPDTDFFPRKSIPEVGMHYRIFHRPSQSRHTFGLESNPFQFLSTISLPELMF